MMNEINPVRTKDFKIIGLICDCGKAFKIDDFDREYICECGRDLDLNCGLVTEWN